MLLVCGPIEALGAQIVVNEPLEARHLGMPTGYRRTSLS